MIILLTDEYRLQTGFVFDVDGFSKGFIKNDKLHRNKENGPAVYYEDGEKEYVENEEVVSPP